MQLICSDFRLRVACLLAATGALWSSTASAADDFTITQALLDSMANSVAKVVTGSDYTTYQGKRLGLEGGRRFDDAMHAQVAQAPLCQESASAKEWLELECRILVVVPYNEVCARQDRAKAYCIAFRAAPFVLREPQLIRAFEDGARRPGSVSPSVLELREKFGVPDLHAPGMRMTPEADRLTLEELKASGRSVLLLKDPSGIYFISIDRS